METIITLGGKPYTFETKEGVTALKQTSESTASTDTNNPTLNVPSAWLITRKNGAPLFAVKPNAGEPPFRVITADKLYSERIQWFEPLADNYRALIWTHPDSPAPSTDTYSAYKHFTWQNIIDFSKIDRPSISFYSGNQGDWKQAQDGGAGYLLVMIEGQPFWADAIGQIPFAVDTFKLKFERFKNKDRAITETVQTGINWGDGTLFGSSDPSNEYDNYMVLRGALWASDNHRLTTEERQMFTPGGLTSIELTRATFTPTSDARLKASITNDSVSAYGVWKQGK
ncbi:hypothetical protein N5C28_13070 [Pseudomonas sp. GD03944]|nr:hypothetical protein [Pseudomonas sp. GD03944]MDH1263870.1 hypothetical protein [Pseudomonas sp. GD03944]